MTQKNDIIGITFRKIFFFQQINNKNMDSQSEAWAFKATVYVFYPEICDPGPQNQS